jgi:hypothetical protein
MERLHQRIAEQVLPYTRKRTTRYFLTPALIFHVLHTRLGRLIHDKRIIDAYEQYIEFLIGEWRVAGKKQADYCLRFPLVDEETDPDNYFVYFVICGVDGTEIQQPIPYKRLLELEPDDFLRLAALAAL